MSLEGFVYKWIVRVSPKAAKKLSGFPLFYQKIKGKS